MTLGKLLGFMVCKAEIFNQMFLLNHDYFILKFGGWGGGF